MSSLDRFRLTGMSLVLTLTRIARGAVGSGAALRSEWKFQTEKGPDGEDPEQ